MLKTKLNFLFIGIVLILTSFMIIANAQTSDARPNGQFEGIRYDYGIRDYKDSGTHSDRVSLDNSENWDRTSSYSMKIRIPLSRGRAVATYYLMYTDNPDFGQLEEKSAISKLIFVNESVVYESNSPLVPDGIFSIMDFVTKLNESNTPFVYTESSTASIPVYTFESKEYVDFTIAPVIYLRVGTDDLNSNTGYFYEFYPSHQVISGDFQIIPVNVVSRNFGFFESFGYYQFEYDYEVSGKKAEVNIFDNGSLSVKYEAFLENDLNYTEIGSYYTKINSEHNIQSIFSVIGDHSFTYNGTTYKFTDGQPLPAEFIINPESYNSSYSFNGYTNSSWVIDGRIQSVSAAQSITQVLTPPSLNQKIIWQNSFPAVLQAFTKQRQNLEEKVNPDGSPIDETSSSGAIKSESDEAANMEFSPESNSISYRPDIVLGHTGYLEAYQYDYSYTGSYDSNITSSNRVDPDFTSGVNNAGVDGQSTLGSSGGDYSYEYSYSMGNIDQEYEANLIWLDPVRSNGKVTFAWALELIDFPTSWFLNYYENVDAPMDLKFGYIYEIDVNAVTRIADTSLSLTFEYGELVPKIKELMQGYSLVTSSYTQWIMKKELAVQKDLLNSVSEVRDQVKFRTPDKSLGDIEFGSSKKVYSLFTPKGEFKYEVITSIMALYYYSNIHNAAGDSTTGSQSKVETVTQEKMKSVYLLNSASKIIPNFRIRSYIIMITYPVWSGNKIVHDPTYASVSELDKYSGENYVSTGTVITSTTPAETASGFEAVLLVTGIVSIALIKRKNK